jgi:hypothetical protein
LHGDDGKKHPAGPENQAHRDERVADIVQCGPGDRKALRITGRISFVFVVLIHHRRRVGHFNARPGCCDSERAEMNAIRLTAVGSSGAN